MKTQAYRHFCAVLLLCLVHFKPARSGAQIWIRFVYYQNDHGLAHDGHRCDPAIYLSRSACDPFFTLRVIIDGHSYPTIVTNRAQDQNSVTFNDKIINVNNPIVYNVNTYGSDLWLNVDVHDSDKGSRHDYMGSFSLHYGHAPTPFRAPSAHQEHRLTDNGKAKATLVVRVSVQCHMDYFGPRCATHCRPASDPELGFYECDSAGRKVCLPTYSPKAACRNTFCASQPCQNNGICINVSEGFYCNCRELFGGPTCTQRVSACEHGRACGNGGTCVSGTEHSGCVCPPTFNGSFCELDIDECATEPSPCRGNSSQCDNWFGSFTCRCGKGWRGRICTEDIDECQISVDDGGGCLNGGRCLNFPGGFGCQCPVGFYGDRCELDVDECAEEATGGGPCLSARQRCQNLEGGFVCLCRPQLAGPNCTDSLATLGDAEADELAAALRFGLGLPALMLTLALSGAAAFFVCRRHRRADDRCKDRCMAANNVGFAGTENPVYDVSEDVVSGAERGSSLPPLPPPPLPPRSSAWSWRHDENGGYVQPAGAVPTAHGASAGSGSSTDAYAYALTESIAEYQAT